MHKIICLNGSCEHLNSLVATHQDLSAAMRSINIPEESNDVIRHVLEAGEMIDFDRHPVNEWVLLEHGEVIITIRKETVTESIGLQVENETAVVHFPAGLEHSLKAVSLVDYFVLKGKEQDIGAK